MWYVICSRLLQFQANNLLKYPYNLDNRVTGVIIRCNVYNVLSFILDHMLRLTKTNEEEEQEVTRHSGKLEIYHQNSWLPICFNGWGRKESSVVCQQLGFREGAARGVKDETLHDLRWMTNVTCAGREYRLDACASEFKFNGCKDNEYVSMICS